ncbi:Putative transposase [Sphingomonas antarctica]
MRGFRHWRWHLDEVFVKINGETHYLWRAVDHEGEILESYVTKTRDKASALAFMKKALKRHGTPEAITTDGLKSYGAALRDLGIAQKQTIARHANNRVENSHLPFRRRERAMLRFRLT